MTARAHSTRLWPSPMTQTMTPVYIQIVFNMTTNNPGGPLNSTKPLVLMIYDTAFNGFDMGYAAAQTVVLFVILLIVSLIQLRLLRST